MSLDNTKDIELSDEALESVAGGSHSFPSYMGYGNHNTNTVDQSNIAAIVNGGNRNFNKVSQENNAFIGNGHS